MITEIKIDSIYEGTPSQPIPLRLVPLITGWSVPRLMLPLSLQVHSNHHLLTAYEFILGHTPREATKENILDLTEKIDGEDNKVKQLEILPPNYFVWSDELAQAWVESVLEMVWPDSISDADNKLTWHPALGVYEQLIDECPDLSSLVTTQGKKRGRPINSATKQRHQEICKKFSTLLADPALNNNASEAARKIAKAEKKGLDPEFYRGIYYKACQKK